MDRLLIGLAIVLLIGLAVDQVRRRPIALGMRARLADWRERRALEQVAKRADDANAALATMQPNDPGAERRLLEAAVARGTEDVLRAARSMGVQMSAREAEAHARDLMAEAGLS